MKYNNQEDNVMPWSTFVNTFLLVVIVLFLFNFNFYVFNAGAAVGPITGQGTPRFIPKWITPSPIDYTLSDQGTTNVPKTSGNAFGNNIITKTLTSGVTQPITITATGMPAGVSVGYDANRNCSPSCSSTITFTVPSNTPVGTYSITVTGSPLNKQTSFNLVVSGSPMSVSCSASPSPALIGQTVTWTANVSGGTPPFTYSWSGTNIPSSPAPNTNPFNISYSTIGQKTTTVTVTDTDSVQATCPASTVQINFNPKFEEF